METTPKLDNTADAAIRNLLAREVRTEGSAKTPEERTKLETGFRQRISSENADVDTRREDARTQQGG